MIDKHNALVSLCPGAAFVIRNGELEWLDKKQTQPTEVEIEAEIVRLQTEYDALAYSRARATSFPTWQEQMDMLWHAIDTGDWTAAKVKTTDFYTKLKKVKDDNPKPS